MEAALALALKLAAAYVLMFSLCPALGRRVPRADRVLIPTSRPRYTVGAVAGSLVLYTAAALAVAGGPGPLGLRRTPDAVRQGLLGGAALWVLVSMFTLAAARQARAQAKALGLERPLDYLVHATWYAFVWAAFREELFFRGLVQGLATAALPGGWGLLLPLLVFALAHYHNTANPIVALVWVLSTLPSGLVLVAVYHASGSLWAPVLAHGLNNAAAGLVTAVAAFRPRWAVPASLGVGAAGAAYLAWQWPALLELVRGTAEALGTGLRAGAAPGLLATALVAGAVFLVDRNRTARARVPRTRVPGRGPGSATTGTGSAPGSAEPAP